MTLIGRYDPEPQKAYVERLLRAYGSLSTYDCLYNLAYHDGRKCAISRLAALIFELRADGWLIDTDDAQGELAVYRLRYAPPIAEPRVTGRGRAPVAPVAAPEPDAPVLLSIEPPEPPAPSWAGAWRCADCGGRPASEPQPMLGDLGRGFCSGCGAQRYFRRAA
jgi:hypothetical protein